MRIGFSRAARLVDMMEAEGLVSPSAGGKPREVLVDRGQPGAAVDHEHERVGLADRAQRLAVDARADHVVRGLGIEPAGVDHAHRGAEVIALAVAAIAGEVRGVVDERGPAADEPVEQRRLADVRPADDGHERRVGRGHDLCPV